MKKENSMKWIFVIALLASLIIVISATGYYLQQEPTTNKGNATLIIKSLGTTKTERFKFTKGTPLGILKYNHRVETILNDNFIECIDNVCADGNYLWLMHINNKSINYGAKRYKLKDKDVIMFEFTKGNTGEK